MLSLGVGFLVGAAGVSRAWGQTVAGTIPADWPTAMVAPVAVPLPAGDWGTGGLLAQVRVGDSGEVKRVNAQMEPADPIAGTPMRAWFMWAAGPADRGKPVSVTFEKVAAVKPLYVSKYADPLLTIVGADARPLLTYYHGKPEVGQRYPLTDYIHPLLGLDGEALTVVRPQDHEHHRGIFWAWVRHEQDGKSIGDWWHPTDIRVDSGEIHPADGPVHARFAAQHTWVYQPQAGQPEPFMNEWVVCRVFPATHQGQAIDVDLALVGMRDKLRLGGTLEKEKGYGGFTIRYAQAREPEIVADGKKVTKDLNQLRAAWADYSAVFMRLPGQPNSERTGAAILVDPHHPDFPPEWITRLYGVLNVSYPGLRMLDLARDQPLRLRYRLWIHRGDAAQGHVDAAYKAFAADWQWRPAGTTQTAPGM